MGLAPERGTNLSSDPIPAHGASMQPTQRNPEVDKFIDHIRLNRLGEHAHKGVDGNGEEQVFVCREALRAYWERDKIVAVLKHDNNTEAHPGVIEESFLETFSILCYISCSAYLNDFTSILDISDGYLPIKQHHYWDSPRYDDAGFRHALARFCEEQWKFKPLVFENVIHRKKLPAEHILPIVYDRMPLRPANDESAVYKASVHPCCVGSGFNKDVVFKMLGSEPRERDLWDNEVDAYTSLASSSPSDLGYKALTAIAPSATVASSFKYITRCLGTFERTPPQGAHRHRQAAPTPRGPPRGKDQDNLIPFPIARDLVDKPHVIILEYARGGNLTTFCEQHHRLVSSPRREDRVDLWHQMFYLLRALYSIHILDGTHQDIKESNVLCMYEEGLPNDREKVCFKLADLGRSHFNRHGSGGTERERYRNKFGNRIYTDELEQTLPRPYTKAADIWGMGCLFSDMLVRSSLGKEGVESYRLARIAENEQTRVRNHEPRCFHDGIERLSCVDKFHRKALQKYPEDDVLRAVSEIILDNMLKPKEKRADDVLTIYRRWENHVGARNNADSGPAEAGTSISPSTATPVPHSPPRPAPPGFHRQRTVPPAAATPAMTAVVSMDTTPAPITVQDIADFLRRPQKPWSSARSGAEVRATFPDLTHALSVMGYRTHHFVVDSSRSMARFRDKVADTIWVLSKLLKSWVARRDNVKLSILADDRLQPYALRKSSELANIVRRFPFSHSQSYHLAHWFEHTARGIMDGLARSPNAHMDPISIYILTDGEFGGVSPVVDTPIHALLDKLGERQTILGSFFSITIIQFRDTPDVCHELRLLQQSILSLENLPPACNPVRICPWDGDVGDMFVGGIRDSTTTLNTITAAARDTTEAEIPNG